jgi:hypothetical protein
LPDIFMVISPLDELIFIVPVNVSPTNVSSPVPVELAGAGHAIFQLTVLPVVL